MEHESVGPFELQVLMAVWSLGIARHEGAYGVMIGDMIAERTGREPSVGKLYAALDRLEQKGFLKSSMGEPTAERGGRRKKYFRITGAGQAAANDMRRTIASLSADLPDAATALVRIWLGMSGPAPALAGAGRARVGRPVPCADYCVMMAANDDDGDNQNSKSIQIIDWQTHINPIRNTSETHANLRDCVTDEIRLSPVIDDKNFYIHAKIIHTNIGYFHTLSKAQMHAVEKDSVYMLCLYIIKAMLKMMRPHKFIPQRAEAAHSVLIFLYGLDTADAVSGDLEERRARIAARKSKTLTNVWFWWQVLGVVLRRLGALASKNTLLGRLANALIARVSGS